VAYRLEVLKGGAVVGALALEGQSAFTCGRSPECDILLEHPSCSRLHAVLQFKPGPAGEVFLFDCGSTHGSFVNKRQLRAHAHAPLAVGDHLRFGASSRAYVLLGPAHLAPAEGLSAAERRQLRQLEAAAAAADEAALRTMELVRARARAEGGDGGVSWGQSLAESADFEEEGERRAPPGGELDWRTYGGKLSERQAASRDKLLRKEATIANLESEIERIQAKEREEGGLTPGQASTLARNEQALEKLQEEVRDHLTMAYCSLESVEAAVTSPAAI
jgi:hypothetical protein